MHFLSDTAPITLHTDASDYGVGGYLFQTVDGKDQPVVSVSKSLNKSQLRWSVIQKESAILLSIPGMNSNVKLNSLKAMYHRTIIGFEASVMNNKFL